MNRFLIAFVIWFLVTAFVRIISETPSTFHSCYNGILYNSVVGENGKISAITPIIDLSTMQTKGCNT
jgi:hypothetical protein